MNAGAVEIGFEERSLGALYFSFGIGIGMFVLRWGLYEAVTEVFGSLSLEQVIILTIFIGSFIGSVFYNLRVDLLVEWLTRKLVARLFRKKKGNESGALVDIAHIDALFHAWDSEVWESVEKDSEHAVKDAVSDPAVQSLLWDIKGGVFSAFSIILAAVALHNTIHLSWFLSMITIAVMVFCVPLHRNWDRKLIVCVAKMKWYREGMEKLIHKKEAGTSLDIGIAPKKAHQLGDEISKVLVTREYESFERHFEILTNTIRRFGGMSAERYVDETLSSYLYRAVVRDYSKSNTRTRLDYRRLFEELRRLFKMTGALAKSKIDWMSIKLEAQMKPLLFFDSVPLDAFTGHYAIQGKVVLKDIRDLIRNASEKTKEKYLTSIGETLVRYDSKTPRAVGTDFFHLLNGDLDMMKGVGLPVIAAILKGGLSDDILKLAFPEMVKRFVEIASSKELLQYVGKGHLQGVLSSIYKLSQARPDSKEEVKKHKSVYFKTGMDELTEMLK